MIIRALSQALRILFFLCFIFVGIDDALGKELAVEEVIAAHLKSIGTPEALAGIKNRGIGGNTSVQFIQGGMGKMTGQFILISAGPSLGLILRYGALEYPGEYIAYDGMEVTVSHISPGQRSPLADFIYRNGGLVKEGLLTGVLSVGWPLLDIASKNPTLRLGTTSIDGRKCYEMEYIPKSDLNNVKVKLFFDAATFHHIKTEYRLRVRGEQALQADQTVTRGVPSSPAGGAGVVTRPAGIQDPITDSIYVLTEKFDDFKEVNLKEATGKVRNLVLPHSYSIDYSVEGQGSTFLAKWNLQADQWIQNGQIDASMFKAR